MAGFQDAFKRLKMTIEQNIHPLNFPGLAIGITNHERLLFCGVYGSANQETQQPVTPETLFQIGSISKSFSSIVLLQFQEQALLSIDDPITKHLPYSHPPVGYRRAAPSNWSWLFSGGCRPALTRVYQI